MKTRWFADSRMSRKIAACSRFAREASALSAKGLENEWTFGVVGEFGTDVLDPPSPFRSEKVEAKAILGGIGYG